MHRCTGSQAQASVAFWVIHVESRSAFRFSIYRALRPRVRGGLGESMPRAAQSHCTAKRRGFFGESEKKDCIFEIAVL